MENTSNCTYCANCMKPLEVIGINPLDSSKGYSSIIWTPNEGLSNPEGVKRVSIYNALQILFNKPTFKLPLDASLEDLTSKTLQEEDSAKWNLCKLCWKTLKDLFQFYIEFIEFSQTNSLVWNKFFANILRKGDVNKYQTTNVLDRDQQKFSQQSSSYVVKVEQEDIPEDHDLNLDDYDNFLEDQQQPQFQPFLIVPDQDDNNIYNSQIPLENEEEIPRVKRGRHLILKDESYEEDQSPSENYSTEDQDSSSDSDFKFRRGGNTTTRLRRKFKLIKHEPPITVQSSTPSQSNHSVPKRGRPKKVQSSSSKRKRGRPKKTDKDSEKIALIDGSEGPVLVHHPKILKRSRKGIDKTYPCPLCGKESKTSWNRTLHIRCVHEKARPFKCTECPKDFFAKCSLVHHIKRFHQEGLEVESSLKSPAYLPYKCLEPGCGKSYGYPVSLKRHMFEHKSIEDRPFVCGICQKRFITRENLQSHSAVHTDEKLYMCELCGSPFKNHPRLRKHMRTQHPTPDKKEIMEKRCTCKICGKVLRNMCNLRAHMQSVHEGLKPHACPFCESKFSSNNNLKTHINGVSGSKDGGCQSRMSKKFAANFPNKKSYNFNNTPNPNIVTCVTASSEDINDVTVAANTWSNTIGPSWTP